MYPYAVAGGPFMPGDSEPITLEISNRSNSKLISVAGMLVTTNGAFFAVHDIWFIGRGKVIVDAPAYDAGSEKNTEECRDIPGPPCGEPNEHPADEAEGYVHVHAGIYGIAPIEEEDDPRLVPAEHNWNNPVAKITIRRIYSLFSMLPWPYLLSARVEGRLRVQRGLEQYNPMAKDLSI